MLRIAEDALTFDDMLLSAELSILPKDTDLTISLTQEIKFTLFKTNKYFFSCWICKIFDVMYFHLQ